MHDQRRKPNLFKILSRSRYSPTLFSLFAALTFLFLCAIAECFARFSHSLGVRLSVRHTAVLYQNGAITKSSPCTFSRSQVFRDKISYPWVRKFPSNEGVKKRYPLKRRYFAANGSSSAKTVADRYRHAVYYNTHW